MPTTSPNGQETDNLKPPRGKRRCHFLFIPPISHSSNNQPYAFPPPITVSQPSYSSLPPPLQGKETPRGTEQQWWQCDVTHSQNCKMHGWLLGNKSSVVVGDVRETQCWFTQAHGHEAALWSQQMEKQSTDTVSTAYLLPGFFLFYHTAEPYSIDYFKFK